MIMLGAVSHIPEKSREAAKVVKRHFPGRLKLRCVRPLMLKMLFPSQCHPHMPSCTAYLGGVLGQGG